MSKNLVKAYKILINNKISKKKLNMWWKTNLIY